MSGVICTVQGCKHRLFTRSLCEEHDAAKERYGHPTKIATKPQHLPEHIAAIWDEMAGQVQVSIGFAGLEALCAQVYRMREAQQKVTDEGAVVSDAKGNPVPHPALKIEKEAQGEVRRWIKDYGVR